MFLKTLQFPRIGCAKHKQREKQMRRQNKTRKQMDKQTGEQTNQTNRKCATRIFHMKNATSISNIRTYLKKTRCPNICFPNITISKNSMFQTQTNRETNAQTERNKETDGQTDKCANTPNKHTYNSPREYFT